MVLIFKGYLDYKQVGANLKSCNYNIQLNSVLRIWVSREFYFKISIKDKKNSFLQNNYFYFYTI